MGFCWTVASKNRWTSKSLAAAHSCPWRWTLDEKNNGETDDKVIAFFGGKNVEIWFLLSFFLIFGDFFCDTLFDGLTCFF